MTEHLVAPTHVRPRLPALWAIVLAAPVVGTVYFWLVYLLAELACAEDLALVGETVVRIVVLAAAVAAVVVLTGVAWRADRRRRTASSAATIHDTETERFMATTGLILLGLFALFIAFLALPVIGLSLC